MDIKNKNRKVMLLKFKDCYLVYIIACLKKRLLYAIYYKKNIVHMCFNADCKCICKC